MREWGVDGWAVEPGAGQRVDVGGGSWLDVVLEGAAVGNAMGAFVFTHAVIEQNPPHAHDDWMKILYVLDGDYQFRVGEAEFGGGPGTLAVVPRGSQHAFTTATGGRMLFVCSPGGNEQMFLKMGRLGSDASPKDVDAVAGRYMTNLTGPEAGPWRPSK